MKQNKSISKKRKTILEYGLVIIASIILFAICRSYAVAWRGNTLYGGEVLVLMLPAIWAAAKHTIKEIKAEKELWHF